MSTKIQKKVSKLQDQMSKLNSQRSAPRRAAQPKKKKSKNRGSGQLSPFQRMISDPCNAPLVPGLYGTMEGYLSRFHSVLNVTPALGESMTSGVILWCPKFHNPGNYGSNPTTLAGTAGSDYNLIIIQTNNTGVGLDLTGFNIPGTTVLTPGATFNDGRSLSFKDPAWTFVDGSTCSAARTLSACIRMSYFGQMSTTQGMFAHIDIPLSQLVDSFAPPGSVNMYDSTLTIDGLFATSQKVSRVSLDTVEQKWIPSDDALFLSGVSNTNVRDVDSDVMVACSKGATPGGTTTTFSLGRYSSVNNPRVIGFAWKGLAGSTAPPFQFDCYKNIEWKPEALSGITVPRSVRVAVVPPVHAAVLALDSKGRSWTQEVMHDVESAASSVAKMALAYSGQLVTKSLGF